MWVLGAWVLLSAAGAGSAQLLFSPTTFVERNICNESVLLPCIVTNLQANNKKVMYVKWKIQGKLFFSFDGTRQAVRDSMFSSAKLVSESDLSKGVASILLDKEEAILGNYSCEVTESNREGETTVELKNSTGSWFLPVESACIIVLLFLAIIFCWAQLSVIASKFETVFQKKISIIIACGIFTVVAVVGVILFVPDGYTRGSRAGLGLIVVPAVILMPIQCLLFGMVMDSLSKTAYALISLESVGYIIAVAGFALCVSACPVLHGSVVIAGLAIMAIGALLSLVYVCFVGSRIREHQPPRKAVEEPLNDAKGVMLERCVTKEKN
ncbi:leukocyte surface antigen CD47 isoform X3 [Dromaius novaehollandiae]|uniref:Leukocyte surface antigen CD47 n=1 Tax=Dromaius novaehollandiae TaxID=8790 RepID=A0A8C4JHD9_DRONO|nr:leukocyte surface antigen CD47 isoform X3 [Dromaius novaehollandiae]